ncbi:phosphodiesterase [Geminicoccus flavidas]|uniref:phosphodiesterase n=1 Tax=Geminicoccus flavidas TaxID=2506407 RepID=UPI0013593B42|nr:phosphodiesterase [Geminicoccus flavidas]
MLICQLTDLHVLAEGSLAYGRVAANRMVARAIDRVLRLDQRPDVVVVTGDLTHAGALEEYRSVLGQLQHLPMPVLVVPGNHDRRETLVHGLGPLLLPGQEGARLHLVADGFPVRIVLLDTLVPGSAHGELDAASLAWLDARLAEQPGRPTLVGMHHPPFLCGIAHLDRIALRDSRAFAAVIARHPQVERVVCGHHHRPITTRFAGTVASVAPSVVHQAELALAPDAPARFVLEPPAFQLHRWTPETGLVTHTVQVDDFPGPYPFLAGPDPRA